MRVYLAGPMSGLPDFNFPAFDAAAADLREQGYDVVSPAEMDREHGFDGTTDPPPNWTLGKCLARDLPAIETCSAIVLLPGWQKSKGARIERHFAELYDKSAYLYCSVCESLVRDNRKVEALWLSMK